MHRVHNMFPIRYDSCSMLRIPAKIRYCLLYFIFYFKFWEGTSVKIYKIYTVLLFLFLHQFLYQQISFLQLFRTLFNILIRWLGAKASSLILSAENRVGGGFCLCLCLCVCVCGGGGGYLVDKIWCLIKVVCWCSLNLIRPSENKIFNIMNRLV